MFFARVPPSGESHDGGKQASRPGKWFTFSALFSFLVVEIHYTVLFLYTSMFFIMSMFFTMRFGSAQLAADPAAQGMTDQDLNNILNEMDTSFYRRQKDDGLKVVCKWLMLILIDVICMFSHTCITPSENLMGVGGHSAQQHRTASP